MQEEAQMMGREIICIVHIRELYGEIDIFFCHVLRKPAA
jgi:hypothetical protein